jgi:hypothetical protein
MAGQPGRSGGRRQGRAGNKYPNRTDMRQGPTQPVRTAPGQAYGEAAMQQSAQKAIPLSNAPQAAPSGAPSTPQAAPGGMGGGGPQVIPSLTAPTARPNEPLTAGLSTGAGPGPAVLGPPQDPTLAMLQGVYQKFPNPDILALIQAAKGKGR